MDLISPKLYVEEMAYLQRAQGLGLVSSNHVTPHFHLELQFQGYLMLSSGFGLHGHAHGTHMDMQAKQSHLHKKNKTLQLQYWALKCCSVVEPLSVVFEIVSSTHRTTKTKMLQSHCTYIEYLQSTQTNEETQIPINASKSCHYQDETSLNRNQSLLHLSVVP